MAIRRIDPRPNRLILPALVFGLGAVGTCVLSLPSGAVATGWFGVLFLAILAALGWCERFTLAPYSCPQCRARVDHPQYSGRTRCYYYPRCGVLWDTKVRWNNRDRD
jgi:hypothetical protein